MNNPKQMRKVVYDPLKELMAYYAGRKEETREKAVRGGTVEERLKSRIIDGDRVGLQSDLDEALKRYSALDIVNTILLEGMKVVGDLFGSGQMQLPFVLQSAEVMKASVAYLEQFMDKAESTSKGTMVIATVKGDVHDIGKNLVDIILTNNGYRVVNLGIKCALETMLTAAREHNADAIGMSGLLVKSTLIMKENLEVMSEQGMTLPVVLGGAALTRRYVEQDLRPVYRGFLAYANDAFDGLRFMEQIATSKGASPSHTGTDAVIPAPGSTASTPIGSDEELSGLEAKIALAPVVTTSTVHPATDIPVPPFYGTRVVDDIGLDDVYRYINEVALFRGQWQVRKGKMNDEEYREFVDEKVRPDFDRLKDQAKREGLLRPRLVYGYFPCNAEGNDLLIYEHEGSPKPNFGSQNVRARFTFPRQQKGKGMCLADFFASTDSGKRDVVAFMLVTMGEAASEHARKLFAANNYKEYLYFHGLSVESAEGLAEYWHKQIRQELGIGGRDAAEIKKLFSQGYQGSRYSFGYPACPSLEDHTILFDLLQPGRIGVELTEEFQLVPEQSTDALIVHHPEARYFNI
jgi:5-methyltetrahydrofolate--homocysteine methyltransferase